MQRIRYGPARALAQTPRSLQGQSRCSPRSSPSPCTVLQVRHLLGHPWGSLPTHTAGSRSPCPVQRFSRKLALWDRQRGGKNGVWCFLLMPAVWEDSDMHHQPCRRRARAARHHFQTSVQDGAAHTEGRSSLWEGNSSQFTFSLSFLIFSLQDCDSQC